MLIRVTQEDIDHGQRGFCATCPVALAATRAAGREIRIGYSTWLAGTVTGWLQGERSGPLPKAVSEFIDRFDAGDPVQPFEFELELT